MSKQIVHVAKHAVERMRERCPGFEGTGHRNTAIVMRAMWRDGIDFAQRGPRRLRKVVEHRSEKELVFAWRQLPDGAGAVIITVLTTRQALSDMRSRASKMSPLRKLQEA